MKKIFSILSLCILASSFSVQAEETGTPPPVEIEESNSPKNTSNFRTDFTEIDNFEALINAEITPCTSEQENSKNPSTYQNCKILNWGQDQFDDIPHCQKYFIDKNGKVGELAKSLSRLIAKDIREKREESAYMKDMPQLEKMMADTPLCPGFKDFSPQTKVAFYTWVFELTAFAESGCNPNIKFNTAADVPNGPAVGLYQLELKRETRGWRGGACKTLDEKQILTAEGNTACTEQIFRSFIGKNGMPFGEFNEKTKKTTPFAYWHSHNPMPDAQLKTALAKYSACKTKNPKNYKNACPLDPRAKFYGRLPRFPLCQNALPPQ